MAEEYKKFEFVEQEKNILAFWEENDIFNCSLKQREQRPKFVFFEGPPSANAKPGIHHILARVYKDLICRFKTMQGYYVLRKGGWDTHGLPIELQVEKALGFKNKDDIENYGVVEFNKRARELIWQYQKDWEDLTKRIGFWINLTDAYITCDPYYMETEWWILKQIWEKGLLFKDYKVVPYCPRCGTPLSSHEVAQGYETVQDPSLYLKFKIRDKNEYLLVWTTTPWTLPSNLAIAVNPALNYHKYLIKGEIYYALHLPPELEKEAEIIGEVKGQDLLNLAYEPLYDQRQKTSKSEKLYYTWPADFVSSEEGSGLVHMAPYGEDDLEFAKKYDLPLILNVDEKGYFKAEWNLPEGAANKFVKEADPIIFEDLKKRNLLLTGSLKGITHEYPFCWRCHSPLIYYPYETWFIKMSALRNQLIKNNNQINWIPGYIKEGRFGEWLKDIRDWALSRKRYWGTPLNIWVCQNCQHQTAIGSLNELKEKAIKSGTQFYYLRHGEATHNINDHLASYPEKNVSHLTEKGINQIKAVIPELKKLNFDLIISSDLERNKETAEIIRQALNVKVFFDSRLRETNFGILNNQPADEYRKLFKSANERFKKSAPEGETLNQVVLRMMQCLREAKIKYPEKKILIISHGDPLWALKTILNGKNYQTENHKNDYPDLGSWGEIPFVLPINEQGKIDLHKPYVDEVIIQCDQCRGEMKRVPEVIDCWFDSGAMPYAQWYYPFAHKDYIDNQIYYPADYIAEGIDQTRGWFYTLLAISTLLAKGPAYKNVISLGLVLDEHGEKMSKSKGNIVEPEVILNKYGADALRWYFFYINPPGEPKCFNERDLLTNQRRFLSTLYNVFIFFDTYAQKENLEIKKGNLRLLDQWILAQWEKTKELATNKLNAYEINAASRYLDDFVDDLSRWYLRRSRRIFQKPEKLEELTNVSAVLQLVLKEFVQVLAPFCPFLTEFIWQRLSLKDKAKSVHLSDWPQAHPEFQNETLIKEMADLRQLASEVLALRQKAAIKLRQPLKELRIMN